MTYSYLYQMQTTLKFNKLHCLVGKYSQLKCIPQDSIILALSVAITRLPLSSGEYNRGFFNLNVCILFSILLYMDL